MRTFLCSLALVLASGAASALSSGDTGTFVALDQNGQPVEKILRVSRHPAGWKFEDRQPDGSWLDVSCHGGCEHRPATDDDLLELFGSAPPPNLTPECIVNDQYAFCHFIKKSPEERRDGYVLVVRVEEGWHPVSLLRLPGDGEGRDAAPELEGASL